MNDNLTSADLAMFTRFGIDHELLTQARIGRVTDSQARSMFGMTFSGDLSGIVFPYFAPVSNGHSKDHRWMVRIRRDHPQIEDGKPVAKYISEHGVTYKHLYFPPDCEAVLKEPKTPIVLVEAEKSALALWAWNFRTLAGILPVAMGGCYGWTGKRGRDDKGPSIDLDYCNGRDVIILLDSNASTRAQVRQARIRLAHELQNRECIVRIAELPEAEALNGPDDAIAISGDQIISDVLRNARFFADIARGQMETQIFTAAERGRVDGDFLEQCEELLAAIPVDEEREMLTTRLHKVLKGAITKATIKNGVTQRQTEHANAKKQIAEQARQGELKNVVLDAPALISDLERYFCERAYLPEGAALALAYFTLNTWTFDIFDTTPYLDIESAIPGCGKTTVISLLRVCREAISATGLTEAAMFRIISEQRPSLLLDEAEFLEGKSERAQNIKAMAHVGYKVGAQVPRCEGDDHKIVWFDVYGPKLFAVIGGITGPLLERSIVIHMEKKPAGLQLKKTRERVLERDSKPLRRQLEAYAAQKRADLGNLYDQEPDEGYWPRITDREAEIWGPLLIHAKLAGPDAENQLLAACDLLTRQKQDIQAGDYHQALASELLEAVEQHDGERFTPSDLLGYLNGAENWGAKLAKFKDDDSKSKSAAIGRFLKKFRLKSRDRCRVGKQNGTSYLKEEALGVLSSSTPPRTATSATLRHDSSSGVKNKPFSPDAENSSSATPSATPSATHATSGEISDLIVDCRSVADVADFQRALEGHTPDPGSDDEEIEPEGEFYL